MPTRDLSTSIFSTEQTEQGMVEWNVVNVERRQPLGRGSLGALSARKPLLILSFSTVVIIGGFSTIALLKIYFVNKSRVGKFF